MKGTTVDALPWVRTAEGQWHLSVCNLQLHTPTRATTLCHLRAEVCREDRPPSPRWHRDQICKLCADEISELEGVNVP